VKLACFFVHRVARRRWGLMVTILTPDLRDYADSLGLLPLLKSIQKPCNLKKFEGKTIGVDAYGWLHRGTVACAMELALGKPTRK
jgi:hypothetical protein